MKRRIEMAVAGPSWRGYFEVGEELSQKQSVKRHVVSAKYADTIEGIYS